MFTLMGNKCYNIIIVRKCFHGCAKHDLFLSTKIKLDLKEYEWLEQGYISPYIH